jgi:hypothetical protein
MVVVIGNGEGKVTADQAAPFGFEMRHGSIFNRNGDVAMG